MPSPFPGMDPYIERPGLWQGFHNTLIISIMRQLNQVLPSHYFAENDQRVEVGFWDAEDTRALYPDVAVTEGPQMPETQVVTVPQVQFSPSVAEAVLEAPARAKVLYVQIKTHPENRLVTVIEVLSPINKKPGNQAHLEYFTKRSDIFASRVHLIELDLLRKGKRLGTDDVLPPAPYYAFLSRHNRRPYTRIWTIQLEDPLPILPVPLLPGDADVPLDLGAAFNHTYDDMVLSRRLDYSQPPLGPLTDAQRAYLDGLLAPLRTPES